MYGKSGASSPLVVISNAHSVAFEGKMNELALLCSCKLETISLLLYPKYTYILFFFIFPNSSTSTSSNSSSTSSTSNSNNILDYTRYWATRLRWRAQYHVRRHVCQKMLRRWPTETMWEKIGTVLRTRMPSQKPITRWKTSYRRNSKRTTTK